MKKTPLLLSILMFAALPARAITVKYNYRPAQIRGMGVAMQHMMTTPLGAGLVKLDPFWGRLDERLREITPRSDHYADYQVGEDVSIQTAYNAAVAAQDSDFAVLKPFVAQLPAAARRTLLLLQFSSLSENERLDLMAQLALAAADAKALALKQAEAARPNTIATVEQAEAYEKALRDLAPYDESIATKHELAKRLAADMKHLKLQLSMETTVKALQSDAKSDEILVKALVMAVLDGGGDAQQVIGSLYDKVLKDDKRAAQWYYYASLRNSEKAQYRLAQMFHQGRAHMLQFNDVAVFSTYKLAQLSRMERSGAKEMLAILTDDSPQSIFADVIDNIPTPDLSRDVVERLAFHAAQNRPEPLQPKTKLQELRELSAKGEPYPYTPMTPVQLSGGLGVAMLGLAGLFARLGEPYGFGLLLSGVFFTIAASCALWDFSRARAARKTVRAYLRRLLPS